MGHTTITSNFSHRTTPTSSRLGIRLKRSDALEIIMMEFLLILGMFSRWVELSRIWRLVLLLLFISLMTKKNFAREFKKLVGSLWFIIPIVLFVLSGLFGDSKEYFFFNLNRIMWPLIIATSIAIITVTKPNVVLDLFDRNFYLLNFIWIINIIILGIQCSGTPLLIKSSWLEINSYYKDQCCGLFGNSGTHELSAFSIFMIMYDLYQGYFRKKKANKEITIGFSFLTATIMLILSTQNDNMSLLFILPMFLLLFYLQKAQWSGRNTGAKILKIFKYVLPIIIIIIFFVQIPSISNYIDVEITRRIERMLRFESIGIWGSNVRTAALVYSFTKGKGWTLGYGVGTWPFAEGVVEKVFYGFSNFGLNSMSTYLMLGGVWLYIASAALFARFLYMASYKKNRTGGYYVICIGIVILFTFYTVLFNSLQTMLWLMMTFISFGLCKDNIIKSKNSSSKRS